MAATHDPLILDYDAENDVLRVFLEAPSEEAVAVPSAGVTLLVSEELDRPIGMVIERFLGRNQDASGLDDAPARAAFFSEEREHFASILPILIRSCAPLAKDNAARWLGMVGR